MSSTKGRISQFSYIKAIACFAVVLLHCFNNARIYHADVISAGQTTAAYAACSALMWAVPSFLMVTGALLLDRDRVIPLSKLFGKYFARMLTALVIFTAIFTFIRHDPAAETSIGQEFIDGLLHNHCMAYLWYLYLMLALYLLMPLFKSMVNRLSDRQLWIAVSAALAICSLLPLAGYFGIDAAQYMPTWVVYGVYLFLGFLLYRRSMDWRIAAILFVLCTAALPLITVRLMPTDIDPAGLTSYNSPLVVLQSASFFSLMLAVKREAGDLIASIDKCTFGIYLIHMIFVRLTMKELGFDPFDYGAAGFIAAAVIYFAVSYAITYLLKMSRVFSFL